MEPRRILVVDDEKDIRDLVRYHLERAGFRVDSLDRGDEVIVRAGEVRPDLVVLDLMLPGLDGREVCRLLRADPETASIPIVMLTAKGNEEEIIHGLDLGADDYVTKPFSPKVLLSRIGAVLRRVPSESSPEGRILAIRALTIDPGRHEVRVNGGRVDLTLTEFRILYLLAKRPGWVYSRYQIVDAVRGEDYPVTDRSVDVQIVGLRKKLGPVGKEIETVRGVGYRLKAVE
ncbi:MAG: response regulator transcription factor [Deltaproteobacteria bacterium]|nr:response regulator transcription factor [Deltaproteobacteria bacterium]